MKKTLRISLALLLTVLLVPFTSCKKDDPEPDVIASFTFAVDATDYKKVTFTNESQNFSALSWNFGDNSALSTETNPVHTFAAVGEYTVTLTATSEKGTTTDVYSTKVTIADPNAMLTMLVGETSKTWKLIRDVSTKRYPLEVGPTVNPTIWWAMGYNNDELALRPCMLNDEWTFTRDGKMEFDDKGDYWAEGSIYPDDLDDMCASSSDPMLNADGVDVSAWSSGSHTFTLESGSAPKLTVTGLGAFLGLSKVASTAEVMVPQNAVTYEVIKLHDGNTDTLIVQTPYTTGDGQSAYWRFVLVHYDNPADEPPIPGNQPSASFTYVLDGKTATFTNTSVYSDSYSWDFGDGSTSTETNPTHTFATDGSFTVTLTATNAQGTNSKSVDILVSSSVLTAEVLQGGAWKIRVAPNSIYVGPGMGDPSWWQTPVGFLDGTAVGTTDDWSCMVDDEFVFTADGKFTFDTKGSTRNDGYFGGTNGCITDAEIAASGENGAKFGSALGDDAHTYTFTAATAESRAIIELTNSATRAAFIGFMKGYYGGENTSNANPPNGGSAVNRYEVMGYTNDGTVETLIVTVDISADHSGTASWTMVMVR